MWRLPRLMLIFWLFIRIFIYLMALILMVKAFDLTVIDQFNKKIKVLDWQKNAQHNQKINQMLILDDYKELKLKAKKQLIDRSLYRGTNRDYIYLKNEWRLHVFEEKIEIICI